MFPTLETQANQSARETFFHKNNFPKSRAYHFYMFRKDFIDFCRFLQDMF